MKSFIVLTSSALGLDGDLSKTTQYEEFMFILLGLLTLLSYPVLKPDAPVEKPQEVMVSSHH